MFRSKEMKDFAQMVHRGAVVQKFGCKWDHSFIHSPYFTIILFLYKL